MSIGQPNKKLRLEQQDAASASSNGPINNRNDDELWGEDLCVDDQLMQEIESQALSQYQMMSKPMQTQNDRYPPPPPPPPPPPQQQQQQIKDYGELEQHLQMKRGEVTNLRMEKDRMTKEFKNQLDAKDEIIRNLNKQLKGKQSELEFQIAEMKSQTCKTPKTYKPLKFQQNASNSPFHERFQFTPGKSFIKDGKVFNFGGQLNRGEVLHKLVRRAFNLNEADFRLGIEKGNDFTWFLNCCLLKLCRFTSFDKCAASDLITLVIARSREVLSNFLKELSVSDERNERKFTDENSKIITLPKTDKDRYRTNETHLLLTNAKWCSEDRSAVAVRQTIATLAKLIQVEEALLIRTIIKPEKPCVNSYENDEYTILDVVELLNEIVEEISLQENSNRYEGVYSSILYFCSTFCVRFGFENLGDKHATHMVNISKKIMFSLPGFVAVRYFVDFLNSSARFGISDHLCHRSAADTFSDNFKNYSFSLDTCVLQVLCAHLEMMDKSSYFVDTFATWLIKMSTTSSRRVDWMRNETNVKLCECLPTLEQTTVRIMLRCVEQSDGDAELTLAEKLMRNSTIKRCFRIFKQFKWQDENFRIHVTNCSMEYEMLLLRLTRIADDHSAEGNDEFVFEETNALQSSNRIPSHSTADVQKLIESVLKFSPIIQQEL